MAVRSFQQIVDEFYGTRVAEQPREPRYYVVGTDVHDRLDSSVVCPFLAQSTAERAAAAINDGVAYPESYTWVGNEDA